MVAMAPSQPRVVVAHLGAKMHYAVPLILERAGMLAHFYTDAYVGPGSSWQWLSLVASLVPDSMRPGGLKRLLARRAEGLPADKVTAFNWLGWRYARAYSRARTWREKIEVHQAYGQEFCRLVLATPWEGQGVYTIRNGALPLLRAARQRGLAAFYEQDIADQVVQYQLLSEEHARFPDWEAPYPSFEDVSPNVDEETEAWELADAIICGSEFVAQGAAARQVPREKIRVVPYGVDVSRYAHDREPWDGRRPLRLLFVGNLSLRKGVHYLYQALERLAGLPLEVRLAGRADLLEEARRRLAGVAQLLGVVPRPEVISHYRWADLFVFPTLCEGSATVIYEALASGLPVITTPNAGSVVRNELEGYIVPIRDPESVAAAIEHLARHPELVAWMSENARSWAWEFSWQKYGERLLAALSAELH